MGERLDPEAMVKETKCCHGRDQGRTLAVRQAGRAYSARWLLACALLLGLLPLSAGCAFGTTPEPSRTPPPTVFQENTAQVPLPTDSPTSIPPGEPRTLTVWVTELVFPLEGGTRADVLAQQIAAFEGTHPGLTVQVLRKKPEGKGGLYDFLLTASAVAPAVVPDLVALDTSLVPAVVREGLAVPLDGLVSAETQRDLYPFAVEACTVDEQLVCLQFEVENVEHAIYNPSKIAVAPLTWTEVFSSGATYIFPAAGQEGLVNDAFLIQYLSTGARLVDGNGDPALDPQALIDVLTFYREGSDRGAILPDVLSYATVENCWPKYLQAEVVMSNISSNLYMTVQGGEATAVPTRDGQAVALSRGYAWVLTGQDPGRRTLAIRLVEWLMSPANLAAWNEAAARLPTRRAAFEQMTHDPYVAFMYTQLEHAVPLPRSEAHDRIYRAMQQAINAVLVDGVQPETAVQNLLKDIGQETAL